MQWKDSIEMGPLNLLLDDLTLYYVLPGDELFVLNLKNVSRHVLLFSNEEISPSENWGLSQRVNVYMNIFISF